MRGAARIRRLQRRLVPRRPGPPPELVRITPEDRKYLTSLYQDTVPLPPQAEVELTADNPRLAELRRAYGALDLPVLARSRWDHGRVGTFLDLRWFRGESLFVWHYRELPRISWLKYYVYASYVRGRDHLGLLGRLVEDGMFGCWTFDYPGWKPVSRDLLQSIDEILFLDRALQITERETLSVLDIGAGYGRLGHRMARALPNLVDYCCVDAIPEATFLSEWYLGFRGCSPPARVVALDRVDELKPGSFDLAVNIHSFSECPFEAVEWWIELLSHLEVPYFLLLPNEPSELLTLEPDHSRQDFGPLLAAAGYVLERREPVIDDPAVRELIPLKDSFHLFRRR